MIEESEYALETQVSVFQLDFMFNKCPILNIYDVLFWQE